MLLVLVVLVVVVVILVELLLLVLVLLAVVLVPLHLLVLLRVGVRKKTWQVQPWCNTIGSSDAVGISSTGSSINNTNGTTPISTSTTSSGTSSSTTAGGSAEKNVASATMVQLLNKLLHPAPRLKYYSSNLMVCENRNVKSIL